MPCPFTDRTANDRIAPRTSMKPSESSSHAFEGWPLRILLCARAYPPDVAGGGEISTSLLARGLTQLGVDTEVLTFTDRASHRETLDGVRVRRLRCPGPYWSFHGGRAGTFKKIAWHLEQAARPLPRQIVREALLDARPTIVHSSTIEDFGPGLWRWASRQGMKTVHTLRSYNLLHRQATLYDARRDRDVGPDLLAIPKRVLATSLAGVVGISRFILERHLQHGFFSRTRQIVIPNPCDEAVEFGPESREPSIRLGILGRISPEKGIEQCLDSLRRVEGGPSWQLEIAGTGDDAYVRYLRERARGLPVSFVGWHESRDFLRRLDLLLVPSRWQEPFGRIVVEAYSVGLPVICLRRGGLPELVQEGKTGWVVEEWDVTNLVAAITSCRGLDRRIIRAEAERYSMLATAGEYLSFYRSLL